MYLTPVSICALYHFMNGFSAGRAGTGAEADNPLTLPRDFSEWVAYRLHFFGATSGWHNMIVERFGDGPHAVERFFLLLDEYYARAPRLVATLEGCQETYTLLYMGTESVESFPSKVSLTACNDEDPGLFVSAECDEDFPGRGFCPCLSSFEMRFGPCRSKLVILDQAAFDRWAREPPGD